MGKTTPVLNVKGFRYRLDTVSLTTNTWDSWAQGANPNIDVDTVFRVRIGSEETAGGNDNLATSLEYSYQGGAWTPVGTGTTAPIYSALSGQFADGDSTGSGTTQLLTGRTQTAANGEGDEQNNSVTGHGTNTYKENEWALYIPSSQVANGETIALRIVSATSPITYTSQNAGTITVVEGAANPMNIKLADAFTNTKPTKVKLSGTFTTKTVKRKTGGSF